MLPTIRHTAVTVLVASCLALGPSPLVASAQAPIILTRPPDKPDPAAYYLFYLHGRIIEGNGRRPKHPQYGFYEYDQVLQALARNGTVVISEERPANARLVTFAARVTKQVQALRAAGVPDDHITVVGFSKGGWIAQRISAELSAPIRYVLLAACPTPAEVGKPHAALHGHILSVREQSDSVPTCKPLFAAATPGSTTAETVIALGGGHGAFYRPNPVWLQPVLKFVRTGTPPESAGR